MQPQAQKQFWTPHTSISVLAGRERARHTALHVEDEVKDGVRHHGHACHEVETNDDARTFFTGSANIRYRVPACNKQQ